MLVVRGITFTPVAIPVIEVMCCNDQDDCRNKKIIFNAVKELLGKKKCKTNSKYCYR